MSYKHHTKEVWIVSYKHYTNHELTTNSAHAPFKSIYYLFWGSYGMKAIIYDHYELFS